MNHQSAIERALAGHSDRVIEPMANIGARLDELIARRAEYVQRVANQAKHDAVPMAMIVANLRAAEIAAAQIGVLSEALRDALRSHGALKVYAEARASA